MNESKADLIYKDTMETIISNMKIKKIPDEFPDQINEIAFISYLFKFRDEIIKTMGYALVSKSWIVELANYIKQDKCLEIMAGSGAITSALKAAGTNIIATDNKSWPYDFVAFADIEVLDCIEAIKKYNDVKYIIMSWPPYESSIAYQCLKTMREYNPNAKMIYIGEGYGGCTGDDKFHKVIKYINNEEIDEIRKRYKTWYGIHDTISIGY